MDFVALNFRHISQGISAFGVLPIILSMVSCKYALQNLTKHSLNTFNVIFKSIMASCMTIMHILSISSHCET